MTAEIKLSISGLVYNQTVVGTYGLVLSEENGNRRFSVLIGEPEAQSIALKINNKKPPRPLTHDLIQNLFNVFEVHLLKVLIYDMINDVFFAELHILKANETIIVDARTSDAVALAVRCESPIYIKSDILDLVGTEVETSDESIENVEINNDIELSFEELEKFSKEKLNEILQRALSDEKYEYAVIIRNVITNKKSID